MKKKSRKLIEEKLKDEYQPPFMKIYKKKEDKILKKHNKNNVNFIIISHQIVKFKQKKKIRKSKPIQRIKAL
mgnify:CR=1 FL=1